ncbi:hypothetical protein [Desulfobulbus oligotrophicus]|jgi:hypothetical protein|nr:hypothetical protein [Desulfobulbus oligotrophicus]MDY0391595.1 hypothetical protein [Desulfobulbus oligotrophicus]
MSAEARWRAGRRPAQKMFYRIVELSGNIEWLINSKRENNNS